jgi:hypothetical protein
MCAPLLAGCGFVATTSRWQPQLASRGREPAGDETVLQGEAVVGSAGLSPMLKLTAGARRLITSAVSRQGRCSNSSAAAGSTSMTRVMVADTRHIWSTTWPSASSAST